MKPSVRLGNADVIEWFGMVSIGDLVEILSATNDRSTPRDFILGETRIL